MQPTSETEGAVRESIQRRCQRLGRVLRRGRVRRIRRRRAHHPPLRRRRGRRASRTARGARRVDRRTGARTRARGRTRSRWRGIPGGGRRVAFVAALPVRSRTAGRAAPRFRRRCAGARSRLHRRRGSRRLAAGAGFGVPRREGITAVVGLGACQHPPAGTRNRSVACDLDWCHRGTCASSRASERGPVWPAIAGTFVATLGIVAVGVVASSMRHLERTPSVYG